MQHAWQSLYPPLQSHARGWLDVGDGHRVFWEECGNPLGQAALFVHGGPGAGCSVNDRRWFDPQRYRIVLFDQRGCGRSTPLGGLLCNSTEHLIQDMELLRQHLNIEQWLLLGGSWGSTLALAYAARHANCVSALVLRGVFLGTAVERDALYASLNLPALQAALASSDASTRQAAAHTVLAHEEGLMAWETPASSETATTRSETHIAHAALLVHYALNNYFFLRDGELLQQAAHLSHVPCHIPCHIPCTIVQGELDRVTPAASAAHLHKAWSGSHWYLIAGAGHSSHHPHMARQLIAATDQWARASQELAGDIA